MSNQENERLRGLNPELQPERNAVKRYAKSEDRPHLQRERSRAASDLAQLRREYKNELAEIDNKMEGLAASNPELHAIFANLRERTRQNYEARHTTIVQSVYQRLAEAYRAIPMSEQEIEHELDSEKLSQMSLKEYVELLRRLPPRFFTHVTRQGIRDHASHHYGRMGEFHHGFEGILKNGALDSIYDQALADGITHETVKEVLRGSEITPEHFPTKQQALSQLESMLTRSAVAPASSEFADRKAVHAALEVVADDYYGGERGNEIFMVWPAAFVAKEYHIGTQRMNVPENFAPDEVHKTSQFNDYWLLKKDEKRGSLPIDAGIVFLPAKAEVNPTTGSRYEVDPEGKPLKNPQVDNLLNLLRSAEFADIGDAFTAFIYAQDKLKQHEQDAEAEKRQHHYLTTRTEERLQESRKERDHVQHAQDTYKQLCQKYAIDDPRIRNLANGGWTVAQHLNGLRAFAGKPSLTEMDAIDLENRLSHLGIQYKLAEHTESSRDYWERYFVATGKRPSKIVYYEGTNPTAAFSTFKEATGIIYASSEANLTELFKENLIGQEGIKSVLTPEAERMREIGREVIEEMYSDTAAVA